jgi:hypothetical protein
MSRRVRGPQVRRCGLKHQKEKRGMDYFAGLDVSVKGRCLHCGRDARHTLALAETREAQKPDQKRLALKVGADVQGLLRRVVLQVTSIQQVAR